MKRWLWLALQLASFALFALLLWLAGPESWRQVFSGDLSYVVLAFLFTGAAQMLSAERLRIVGRSVSRRPVASWREIYHVAMTAQLLGLALPRGLSAIGGKAVGLRALGVSLKRSMAMVVLDNLFDLVVLALLAVPGLLFAAGHLAAGGFLLLEAGLVILMVVAIGWLGDGRRPPIDWLQRIPRLGHRLHSQAQLVLERLPDRTAAWRALFLTLTLSTALALRFYYIGRAIDVEAGWLLFVALFPVTQLSLIVAVAPGGLGVFDLSWLGLLRLAGVFEGEALAFAITQRAYITVFIFIWTGFSALLSLTVKKRVVTTLEYDQVSNDQGDSEGRAEFL